MKAPGPLCQTGTSASSLDEFRAVVQKRMRVFCVLCAIGLFMMAAGAAGEFVFHVQVLDSHALGVISGMGAGLAVCMAVFLLMHRRVLKDDAKLKKMRIETIDERTQQIRTKALLLAFWVLLIGVYAVGIVCLLFVSRAVGYTMFLLVALFLAAYYITYKVYDTRM